MDMHIAELNIARLKYDLDDPRVADFVDNLDRVNGVAERSEGFQWRLKDEAGNATGIPASDDPRVIVNLSVWDTVQNLENFVFKTVHKRIYDRRAEWFSVMDRMHFVMWWVPVGHQPTVSEALSRLESLNANGSSNEAFGWDHIPEAQLWRTLRCDRSAA